MKIVDRKLLDQLTTQARENPRLRKNWNIHPSDDFCCHRLLNAIEPGSYIRPHRHLDQAKDETFLIVRGRLGVVLFDEAGEVVKKVLLAADGDTLALDIPHGIFHTAVSLAPGTVFFEAKAGPYVPLAAGERADWAPEDGAPAVEPYLSSLVRLF